MRIHAAISLYVSATTSAKNEIYSNPDIVQERSHLNIRFKGCDGTYTQAFDKLLEEGTISTRGLKPDADVFAEMVFDVNTLYFDEHGGYDYAKDFFVEAYRMAVKEAGGEQYILSAVMHADERNKSLSEELGRDVYHYHLHVVYIPVVGKRNPVDKALQGQGAGWHGQGGDSSGQPFQEVGVSKGCGRAGRTNTERERESGADPVLFASTGQVF